MFLRNIAMAIILALFYCCYLGSLANAAKKVTSPEKQGGVIMIQIIKVIFYGVTLNTLLTLLGVTSFCFTDIFISTSLIILLQII